MDAKQISQVRELLGDCLYEIEDYNIKTLPLYREIYERVILPSKNTMTFSSALVVILCEFSRILNYYKFTINLDFEPNKPLVPMNMYGFNILKSGGGKGLTTGCINNLLNFDYQKEQYLLELQRIQSNYFETKEEKKDFDGVINKLNILNGAEEMASATTAGLRNYYKMINDCFDFMNLNKDERFGSMFFNISEFADILQNASAIDNDFLSTLKEMYDLGKFSAKSKGEDLKPAMDIFISMLCATTDKTLQEDSKVSKAFNSYLISGNARRCLLAFPSDEEMQEVLERQKVTDGLSLDELFEAMRYKETSQDVELRKKVQNLVSKACYLFKTHKNQMRVTFEGQKHYFFYKLLCAERAKGVKSSILEVEILNRYWKALKVAGLLAFFDNSLEINEKYIKEGIRIVEFFSFHLKRLLNNRVLDVADKIVELLLDARGKAISRRELSQNNEILSFNKTNMSGSDFIDKNIPAVNETLDTTNYQLIVKNLGKTKPNYYYAICPDSWSNPDINPKTFKVFDKVPKGDK